MGYSDMDYLDAKLALLQSEGDECIAVTLFKEHRRRRAVSHIKEFIHRVKEGRIRPRHKSVSSPATPRSSKVSNKEAKKAAKILMDGYTVDGMHRQYTSFRQVRKCFFHGSMHLMPNFCIGAY
jgi:hypothetical protein